MLVWRGWGEVLIEKFSDGIASIAKQFLGPLFSIPYAGLRRISQGMDDKTDGRSIVANQLAQAAADELKKDPAAVAKAIELYAPGAIRKVQNTSAVLLGADEELKKDTEREYIDPDIDWLNSFQRYAEDASSERMRGVMGKILAGEIKKSNSFSLGAVRTITEISPAVAQDFKEIYSEVIDDAILRTGNLIGKKWIKLNNIQSAGLISLTEANRYSPQVPSNAFLGADKVPIIGWRNGSEPIFLNIILAANSRHSYPIYSLTNIGIELGQLFDPPMPEESLRKIAEMYKNVAKSITLWKNGHQEVIK